MRRKRPRSLVLVGNGINCEYESSHAHRLAGFDVDLLHINEVNEHPERIHQYSFLNLPGGFLDGDDLGAAKAQAVKWKYQKMDRAKGRFISELVSFVEEGKIILGICNGFQLLVKTGLLPALGGQHGNQTVTLTFNDSGRFEDRWVNLAVNGSSPCIFTAGMERVYLPVRHGEGKLIADSDGLLDDLKKRGHIVLQYADEAGRITDEYPYNPNGSSLSIAGICDESGLIFGLMPHPEAYVHFTHHPRWTREHLDEEGEGLKIFRNAYRYVVEHS
jgi:phosphoribosylformylglycinamidine synthase subunit PurQ / glutaminase